MIRTPEEKPKAFVTGRRSSLAAALASSLGVSAPSQRQPLPDDPLSLDLQANKFELDFAKVGKALKQPKTDSVRKRARRREKLARRRNR